MPSLNKVMLIGNVGRDPEVRYLDGNGQSSQGTKVATFTLATTERYRDRSGELRENTEWHNIVAWRQTADVAEKFIRKGTQVFIEGRLRTRSWTDAQGVKKYTTEITVDNLQLLGRRDSDGTSQGGYQPQGGYQQGGSYQAAAAPRGQFQQPFANGSTQRSGQNAASAPQFGQSASTQPETAAQQFEQTSAPAQQYNQPNAPFGQSQTIQPGFPQPQSQADTQQAIDLGAEDPTDDLPF